jgi:hypothetical protein
MNERATPELLVKMRRIDSRQIARVGNVNIMEDTFGIEKVSSRDSSAIRMTYEYLQLPRATRRSKATKFIEWLWKLFQWMQK